MKINKYTAYDVRRQWQQGVSQDALAEMYDCTRQYINRIILNQQYASDSYSYLKTKAKRDTGIQLQKLYAKIEDEKTIAQNKATEQQAKLSYLETLEKHIENQE